MATYFITGISGFLGRNLVLLLKQRENVKIVGLALPSDYGLEFYKDDPDVTIVEGNICDKESVARFLSSASGECYLIHAAARVSLYAHLDKKTTEVNVQGPKNVIDEAMKHDFRKVVYVSSVDALFQTGEGVVYAPDHFDPKHCPGVYGKSKAEASNYVLSCCKEHNLPGVMVCPSAMIGPNDPFIGPMNDAIRRFCQGKIPVLTPGGYDVDDVRDVADGILKALELGKPGETYILGGHRASVREIFEIASRISGRKVPKITLPFFLLYMVAPFAEIFARITRKRPMFSPLAIKLLSHNPDYDRSKAERELGYKVRDLDESIADLIHWMKQRKILD